jgi:hypothetical protein
MNIIKKIIEKKYPILKDEKYIIQNVRPVGILNNEDIIPYKFCVEDSSFFINDDILDHLNDFKKNIDLYSFLRGIKEINTKGIVNEYIRNGYYPTPDAEVYAGFIAKYQPQNIIEIGSGYSTIIAKKSIDFLNLETKITIVDPQPRTDIDLYADHKIFKPVEQTTPDNYLLPGSIIFIDSSHILRAGGDLPFIYNVIIPSLPKGTIVHVHDIYLPYDYPNIYYKWYYNEQYILYSLLTNTNRYKILMATHILNRKYTSVMENILNTKAISKLDSFGAALWFKVI